ncbi:MULTISPECIES: choline-binding protein CbpJ [Streptococcus]|uniref:choline-binding protein CbpJ n=1 Tax=Streptococcus TaxID=1301 RepID=UPI00025AB381|nr:MULTISPECIES: choline-binding protein CbpJ [Streptococcus]EID29858.1 cell wall-binding repeat protein [Streptococcus pseudopneumoniae ATCC BAA-960 = CCUG 49455]EID70861.1 cell wall-binding repeat protein [Streptococcus pseudopneumoniae SK674]MBF9607090.1 choline-binding protein CbpJ [Streptococcus pseudopneumoniae]MBF9638947.1 choline-binding protein CbpJ [Streptococcus pseudopneumoniae]MBF9640775.1 choline-binding protein CbpJ [Streptococcus pseudopneumoniae]
MKLLKKTMQAGLTVIFFGLLGTSTVFADDSEGWQFVQENGRTYYKKGNLKETYWRVIDGKYYYFDSLSGEMVVGWQYIPFPSKGSTIDPYPNGIRLEGFPKSEWYYFDENGVLQEFVGWQELELKYSLTVGKKHGEGWEGPEVLKLAYYYFDQDHYLKTGWLYDQSNWYYLAKTGNSGNKNLGGERRVGWINDGSAWYYLDSETGIMQTGWKQIGNKWYYLRSSGAMATGWAYVGNNWYYLRSSGAMSTGWVKDGSIWYYLNASNGDMKTGWFQINGKWYYAYGSGALAVNTTVDGYYVNYNGEWVK